MKTQKLGLLTIRQKVFSVHIVHFDNSRYILVFSNNDNEIICDPSNNYIT